MSLSCKAIWLIVLALLLVMICPVRGHEAPSGWAYDMECCSTQDCRPLSLLEEKSIRQVVGGYQATLDGFAEPVLFSQNKIKPSKDGFYHACVGSSGIGYCLYVPMGV